MVRFVCFMLTRLVSKNRNVFIRSHVLGQMLEITDRDRVYTCLPLFHSSGSVISLTTWHVGGAVVLRRSFSVRVCVQHDMNYMLFNVHVKILGIFNDFLIVGILEWLSQVRCHCFYLHWGALQVLGGSSRKPQRQESQGTLVALYSSYCTSTVLPVGTIIAGFMILNSFNTDSTCSWQWSATWRLGEISGKIRNQGN
jgi:hypothetical protein